MKKREIKPMLKQNKINHIDNPKGVKKGFRYKAAAAVFAVMGALMLASCSFEPTISEPTPVPTPTPGPVEMVGQTVSYDNGNWDFRLKGFTTEEEANAAIEQLSNNVSSIFSLSSYDSNGNTFWEIDSSLFDIDQINKLALIADDNLYCVANGPCENVTISNLTLDELKNIYTNLDISWGDITISQELSPNNEYNIGYKVVINNIKKTDADALISLVSDQTKVRVRHDSYNLFTIKCTKEQVMDIFNVDKNDLTATYQDNYGSDDSFLSVIGDDLSNTKITKIIDVDGQEIATHSEPELGL